ncbi:MAG: hypothetical protein IH851_05105 [Armatimonadetes bacterium]|nr:hypothetical protein [Armatimonadota bacterium]
MEQRVFAITICVALFISVGCRRSHNGLEPSSTTAVDTSSVERDEVTDTVRPTDVDKVLALLRECAPVAPDKPGEEGRNPYIITALRIGQYELEDIREAGLLYSKETGGFRDLEAYDRLYVLCKIVFDVPTEPSDFGPHASLWPVSINDDRQLVLVGAYGGRTGQWLAFEYNFDNYLEFYGRRDLRPFRSQWEGGDSS